MIRVVIREPDGAPTRVLTSSESFAFAYYWAHVTFGLPDWDHATSRANAW